MSAPTRLSRPDVIGVAVSGIGLLWALLAVVKLQPAYLSLFADMGAELPALTQAFLRPWLPPVLSSVAPITMGLSIGFNAPSPLRVVAYFVAAFFTLAQVGGFMVAMYLPVFTIADRIH